MEKAEIFVDIEKFVRFHRKRVLVLKDFVRKNSHGRLVFQISFLGLESLASLLYPNERDSSKRLISVLSLPNFGVSKDEATKLCGFWRNSLIHQGFIANPWTTLEAWGDYDDIFLIFPDGLKSSVELIPESIIGIYESRIDYLEDYFKVKSIKEIHL